MTTKTIPLTSVSTQQAKPTTRFGQLATIPVSIANNAFLRASLAGISSDAVVSSAVLTLRTHNSPNYAGARTLKVRYVSAPFSTATTWNTRPASVGASEVTQTQTNAIFGAYWNIDVTAIVQSWISGTVVNNGFAIFTADTTPVGQIQGAVAAWGAPYLTLNYTVSPVTPTALHPSSGAVNLAKPTVTFQAGSDVTSIQVQVDAAANGVAPAFDSNEVASTAGLLDLSAYSTSRTATVSTTSASATVTSATAAFVASDIGQSITGTGIPVGATITAVASGTSVTISANATATGTPTATLARVYLGLADGASTQWRARAKNGLGWSAWSSWVTFSRAAWKTLTITSPTSTSEDPSPVVTATYGGAITAWRVLSRNSLGANLEDSGWTSGSAVAFGTTKSVGASGSVVVQVRDNVLRDATPGDPDYVQATQAFTVTPSGTPSVIASFAVSQDNVHPQVTLTGSRAAGVPDEVAIYRDGVLVGRTPGASVFTGTTMTYVDATVPMNVATTYKVYAIVNGAWSNASSTVTLTPRCLGVWLIDPAGSSAMLLGNDDMDQSQPETAVVHRPLSGPDGQVQAVRRRLARYPREGVVSGTLIDALGVTAASSEAALRAWADNDAGYVYRLVLGNQNDPVILGDIEFHETAQNVRERVLTVSANWWYQA